MGKHNVTRPTFVLIMPPRARAQLDDILDHVKGKSEGLSTGALGTRNPILRLRVNHLHLLEMLVEHGTVRTAAEQLHLSQPAVSQMLKDLEVAFGGRLFSRSRSGVLPTERLRSLLRRVRVVLGELDAAQFELNANSRPTIRIGANLQFLTKHLPGSIGKVWSENSAVHFVLHEANTRDLLHALLQGELDCVIGPMRWLQSPQLQELDFWRLYPSDLCVVVNPSHRLARRKRVHLRDLADEPWALGPPGGQSRQTIEQAFVRAGLHPPAPILECRPHFLTIQIVKQSPFVTVATRVDAIEAEKAGAVRILPIDEMLEFGPIAFVCRKKSSQDPLLTRFRDEMIASARRSAPG